MDTPNVPQEMCHDQVRSVLRFVVATQGDEVTRSIFGELGRQCFHARKLDRWIARYTGDVQAFLDWVNVQHASRYWERLAFSEDGTALALTGRRVSGCACAFADCEEPPLALCHHCCKRFQEELFGMLLGRRVEVEITASFLLGDERCDTIIHLE